MNIEFFIINAMLSVNGSLIMIKHTKGKKKEEKILGLPSCFDCYLFFNGGSPGVTLVKWKNQLYIQHKQQRSESLFEAHDAMFFWNKKASGRK